MTKIKHLNIPQPCRQDWNRMTATDSGRHCQSCCKTVVDFTRMSNDEIIGYLSANHHVCARIGAQQIDSVNMQLVSRQPQNKGGWAKWVVAAALFVSTAYSKANAQSITPSIEQIIGNNPHAESFPLGKIVMPDSGKYHTISGTVVDDTNLPLPGVSVKLDEGNVGTVTDNNGRFSIRVPVSAKKLTVSFVGFERTEVKLKKKGLSGAIELKLKLKAMMMGGLGITRPSLIRQLYAGLVQRLFAGKLNNEV
ncbi:carboxypeptidase-like regulatory domain-containing protein [Mucilaginibacter flavidus]|uniref:carboxypeptidase-like regulatory domain-containing protein n=1 Tax=Mucilaginibacter flavidus TaxID=2949309 RepID=UPI00209394D0|nr:carboxypeptidase-like regulatory domain-containing protein [Mucilaginibacter flavidus]MCO5949423.1 carboxypeptidase-like regulatory domain-containing protein [Mucilaginibacter flavidus]